MKSQSQNKSGKRKVKRKLKKKVKLRLAVFFIITVSAIILYFPIKREVNKILHPVSVGTVRVDRYKDFNALHLIHAKKGGTGHSRQPNI